MKIICHINLLIKLFNLINNVVIVVLIYKFG